MATNVQLTSLVPNLPFARWVRFVIRLDRFAPDFVGAHQSEVRDRTTRFVLRVVLKSSTERKRSWFDYLPLLLDLNIDCQWSRHVVAQTLALNALQFVLRLVELPICRRHVAPKTVHRRLVKNELLAH
jgi:hypothetical protein